MTKQWNYWKPFDYFSLYKYFDARVHKPFLNCMFIKPDNFILHVWVLIYIFATSGIFCNLCLKFGVEGAGTDDIQVSENHITYDT